MVTTTQSAPIGSTLRAQFDALPVHARQQVPALLTASSQLASVDPKAQAFVDATQTAGVAAQQMVDAVNGWLAEVGASSLAERLRAGAPAAIAAGTDALLQRAINAGLHRAFLEASVVRGFVASLPTASSEEQQQRTLRQTKALVADRRGEQPAPPDEMPLFSPLTEYLTVASMYFAAKERGVTVDDLRTEVTRARQELQRSPDEKLNWHASQNLAVLVAAIDGGDRLHAAALQGVYPNLARGLLGSSDQGASRIIRQLGDLVAVGKLAISEPAFEWPILNYLNALDKALALA